MQDLASTERQAGRQDSSHGAGFFPSTVGFDVTSDTHVGMLSDSFFDIYFDQFPGVFPGMLSDIFPGKCSVNKADMLAAINLIRSPRENQQTKKQKRKIKARRNNAGPV